MLIVHFNFTFCLQKGGAGINYQARARILNVNCAKSPSIYKNTHTHISEQNVKSPPCALGVCTWMKYKCVLRARVPDRCIHAIYTYSAQGVYKYTLALAPSFFFFFFPELVVASFAPATAAHSAHCHLHSLAAVESLVVESTERERGGP